VDSDYAQNLRYKLQRRFRKANSCGWETLHYAACQFWSFLQAQPTLTGIVADLERRGAPDADNDAERIFSEGLALFAQTEVESAAIAAAILRRCALPTTQHDKVIKLGYLYGVSNSGEAADRFREYFIEPLYEYVDEQLDDQRIVLALLRKYKQKCEWFQRDALYAMWNGDTGRGEKHLALHLYEYLHDQGMKFYIEPWSASGEVDLIAAQPANDPLLADAKVFNPDRGHGKPYIIAGLRQLYVYTMDYNESAGYLVIFNTSADELRLALTGDALSIPYLVQNNKTLWVIVVDIFPHEETASKRPKPDAVEITQSDFT